MAVLSAVWASIDPKNKPLSAMKVRRWASQLLSRSILLGSSSDGVSMVSVVGVAIVVGSGCNVVSLLICVPVSARYYQRLHTCGSYSKPTTAKAALLL